MTSETLTLIKITRTCISLHTNYLSLLTILKAELWVTVIK